MPARPWTPVPGGVAVAVRLTPKGGRDAVDGVATLADGRAVLKLRVRAAASEGEANAALTRLLARALELPASRVSITGGTTSRSKRVSIAGDPGALIAALERIAAAR
jgi:uncharacterized protein YggU (UPF0235/DUF167 family)